MSVSITCYAGRFNLCDPSEKQWCLVVQTPYGKVSELFHEEPYTDGSVEDALNIIEARLKDYLFSSSRAGKIETISKIRGRLPECEIALLEANIKKNEAVLDGLKKLIESDKKTIAFIAAELAGSNAVKQSHE